MQGQRDDARTTRRCKDNETMQGGGRAAMYDYIIYLIVGAGWAGSLRAQDLTDEYGTAVLRELFESRWRLW